MSRECQKCGQTIHSEEYIRVTNCGESATAGTYKNEGTDYYHRPCFADIGMEIPTDG